MFLDAAGPELRLGPAGLMHPGESGFRPADLHAAGALQPGQTPFHCESSFMDFEDHQDFFTEVTCNITSKHF